MKTSICTLALLGAAILNGCATQSHVVTPISPPLHIPDQKPAWALPLRGGLIDVFIDYKPIPTVEGLQPMLKWRPVAQVETYDLIIYTGVPPYNPNTTPSASETLARKRSWMFVPGKEVYYREMIKDTTHVVEAPLAADSVYVWSVRTRTGTSVSPWATYDVQTGVKTIAKGSFGTAYDRAWWAFQTPK